MKVSKQTKKKPSTSMTTRERMMKRKEDLAKRSGKGLIFPKTGTLRVRIKNPGDDQEIGIEVIQFYLGQELGGVISPATFDEPCPFMEMYDELKSSKNSKDKALAGKLVPKRKYVIGGDVYKDDKGKEVDTDKINRGILIPRGVYQDIIDLYLDEDEWGNMTDPVEGYDIKINRSGSTMTDTSYSVTPCSKKPLPKERRSNIDLEAIVRKEIKTYDELEELLGKYLVTIGDDFDDEDDDEPKKKKDKKKIKVRR